MRAMNSDSARVIGMVLGQSVMLQCYEAAGDRLQDVVQMVNGQMLRGDGPGEGLGRENVLRLRSAIATNSNMSNLVEMCGQRDAVRPGTVAWRDSRYYELSEALSEDLELD